ncbi:hypothetical protein F3J23_15035 [Chryseobacterium sp. Tr-659]|uniref:hypothetical protein n=1 Tax=Chryseobacterium sp. Tr-659 TaxID=2608340 RepID=UPI00141DE104|nr:hypothetical protein [Chryseobacterium sp. Tr-659]NIF06760.1 hypothetical protein [Chryseobacterium sp. Tr-659]
MDINDLINERHGNFTHLKKLIVSINLMPGISKSSFDHITEKLLQHLEKGVDKNKLKIVIETELCLTYGLYTYEFNSEELSETIFDWWKNH